MSGDLTSIPSTKRVSVVSVEKTGGWILRNPQDERSKTDDDYYDALQNSYSLLTNIALQGLRNCRDNVQRSFTVCSDCQKQELQRTIEITRPLYEKGVS